MTSLRDKQLFKARVLEWANKLDVNIHSLSVRPMRNKWASCSTGGNLNFNEELVAFEKEIADVPNHGKLWKSLMRAHLGQYERLQAKLQSCDIGTSSA